MHILILNWRDIKHPLAGGAEKMVWEHALYWKKKGAQVTWISSNFHNAKKEEEVEGVVFKRIGSHYTIHFWVILFAFLNRYSDVDTVVDCFHFLPFFTPLLFKNKKLIAIIHEIAGTVWFDNAFYLIALMGFILEPLFFKFYKKIPFITVSESTKKELLSIGIPEKNIHILQNGIHIPVVPNNIKKTSYPSLLFLNRISLDKGIKDALMAYADIKSKYPAVKFVIAGKEQPAGLLKDLLDGAPIKKDITYLGYVTEQKKWELLKESWLLVHPSKKEGWGMTVIEANAMETSVVGYDVAGLKDSILHNKTGLLVRPDINALSEGIERLLADKKVLKELSKNAKKWAGKFSWKESTERSWELLTK